MPSLEVRLFGKPCVQYADKPLRRLESGKVQQLFCYLLLYGNRPHTREALATLLWEENTAS